MNLKKRRNTKTPKKSFIFKSSKQDNHESDDESNQVAKRNNLVLGNTKPKFASRFLVGLTLTVGVAAIATMYALNSTKDPQEILSKVIQLIT